MKMTPNEYAGGQPQIDGYAPGGFRIAGAFRDGSVLIGPEGPKTWAASALPEVAAAAGPLRSLVGQVDVILLGTGDEIAPAPATLRAELEGAGVGLEPMSTPSACRTYNVLLSEGRRVAIAALPVSGA